MSSIFSPQETNPSRGEKKSPSWSQHYAKRVIPNHLVPKKKPAFQLNSSAIKNDTGPASTTTTSGTATGFTNNEHKMITFGSMSKRSDSLTSDTSGTALQGNANDTLSADNDDIPLYNENEDLPPTRSLGDLNDEVMFSLNKSSQHTESFLNKDPKKFINAFYQTNDNAKSMDEESINNQHSSLQKGGSAVLVFGYPEHMVNQVIAYFAEFGIILEDFDALKSKKKSNYTVLQSLTSTGPFSKKTSSSTCGDPETSYPIFSGSSWVKLTYDNPASAVDALKESGAVFNGVLIGVIPYTKEAVEKLKRRKLTSSEDIGGETQLFSHSENHKVDSDIGDTNDIAASYIKRLDVQDGASLFLKSNVNGKPANEQKKDEKLGYLATLSNYFFGFHDL